MNKNKESVDFYLRIVRKRLITFAGVSLPEPVFDRNAPDAISAFIDYDTKGTRLENIKTKHPNLLKTIVFGKKGWGIQLSQWKEGLKNLQESRTNLEIGETRSLFIFEEFLDVLIEKNLNDIPDKFLKELVHIIQESVLDHNYHFNKAKFYLQNIKNTRNYIQQNKL